MGTVQLPTTAARDDARTPPERERLEDLVRRHQGMVWRYLRLLGADEDEADDLMQETFLRVSRGAAEGETVRAPAAFLRAIARNLLICARRSARLRTPTVEWVDAVDGLTALDPRAFDDARVDALRHCREQLTGRARRAIELHYIDRCSYRDAARALDIGVNGFKALLSRARRALRECVTERLAGANRS